MLNKADILKVEDLVFETVDVPEWGGQVRVRTMTGTERDVFDSHFVSDGGKVNLSNIRARLCAITLVDEKNIRLFNDDDLIALGKKSSAALDRIFGVAQRLNGLGPDVVKELAKN